MGPGLAIRHLPALDVFPVRAFRDPGLACQRLLDDVAVLTEAAGRSRIARDAREPRRRSYLVLKEGGGMRYRVHHFNIRMTKDQARLEQFLNGL